MAFDEDTEGVSIAGLGRADELRVADLERDFHVLRLGDAARVRDDDEGDPAEVK